MDNNCDGVIDEGCPPTPAAGRCALPAAARDLQRHRRRLQRPHRRRHRPGRHVVEGRRQVRDAAPRHRGVQRRHRVLRHAAHALARGLQRHRRQLQRHGRRGHAARHRRQLRRQHRDLPRRHDDRAWAARSVCTAGDGGVPMAEVCNGLDDNCNGIIDEGPFTQTGQTCICPGLDPAKVGVGTCKAGHLVCRGTRGFVCEGCVAARPRDLRRARQRLRRRRRREPDLPVGPRLQGRPLHAAVHARRVPLPQRLQVRGRLLHSAALRGQDLPDRPALRREHRLVHRPLRRRGLQLAEDLPARPVRRLLHARLRRRPDVQRRASARRTSARASTAAPTSTATTATASTCARPTSARARSAASRGACMADSCATVPCPGGQFCDQNDRPCAAIDTCAVTQCGRGQRCIQETGACEADPCNTVNCPGPCWVCAVTSDGIASCQVSGDCREVSAQIGIKGGGDGCGCAVGDSRTRRARAGSRLGCAGLREQAPPRRSDAFGDRSDVLEPSPDCESGPWRLGASAVPTHRDRARGGGAPKPPFP